MKLFAHFRLVAAFATCNLLLTHTHAADSQTKPALNATGTWKWIFKTDAGDSFDRSVTLKQDGEKLTGTSQWPDGTKVAVEDGKIKGDTLSFSLTRDNQGQKFTSRYQGKISGDSITGKIEFTRDGQPQTRDWQAKREKAQPKSGGAGTG